jgi:hypothetical protein
MWESKRESCNAQWYIFGADLCNATAMPASSTRTLQAICVKLVIVAYLRLVRSGLRMPKGHLLLL